MDFQLPIPWGFLTFAGYSIVAAIVGFYVVKLLNGMPKNAEDRNALAAGFFVLAALMCVAGLVGFVMLFVSTKAWIAGLVAAFFAGGAFFTLKAS